MSGRVGVEQTPDIETVLTKAFHRDATFGHGAVDTAAECGACRDIMQALTPVLVAAVLKARAAELREAADALPDATEGPDRISTATWRPYTRDVYSLAIEEAQGALRDRADRITVDAPEGGTDTEGGEGR